MPFELVTPLGTLSHGGVCGLVRGGGDGHLGRRLALSVDNMVCVDVVTADGQLGHAIDAEHPISSGAQGGGGNFGIVTNFELRLRPRDNVAVQSARVLDLRLLRQQDAARHDPDAIHANYRAKRDRFVAAKRTATSPGTCSASGRT